MMSSVLSIWKNEPWLNFRNLAIFIIALFQVSAIIGIQLGYASWFLSRTPLNLIVLSVLTIVAFPVTNRNAIIGFALFFLAGMAVEWIGVHNDFLFGAYEYGSNLGLKIDGVPFLIGLNWAILIFLCGAISRKILKHDIGVILGGALLMVFLDFFIEQKAAAFDFWYFADGLAAIQNYIAWYVISALLLVVYTRLKIQGDFFFALSTYLIQLFFFAYFNFLW